MNPFLPEIPFFCIHLKRETERERFIKEFEKKLGRPVRIWEASEGSEVVARGWPRGHPHEKETSIGALGCLDSHIRLLRNMLSSGKDIIGIFEDDAEMVDSVALEEFYEEASEMKPVWDILILGANEWVESLKSGPMVKPRRYWGTHAFLIRRRAAEAVVAMFEELQKKGFSYPADWLYSYTISQKGLVAYGPLVCRSIIRQKPGLVSAINGKVRV